MATRTVAAVVEWDPEVRVYVGIVPGIPGAHTQAPTLEELKSNLQEVIGLCIEENPDLLDEVPEFIGLQQVQVGA